MTTQTTPPAESPAKLLDVRAVAAMLNCSQRHIYRLSDLDKMPAPLKLGSLVRWSNADIEKWIAEGCPSCRKGSLR